MIAFFERSWGAFFAAFIGSVMALVLIPLLSLGWQRTYEFYDRNNPPVSMRVASYELDAERRLYMRFYVTRHDDCAFLKMQGYSGPTSETMQPSTARRLDGETPIDYPLGITVLSNTWVVYPIYGSEIRLQGYYACGTRIVRPILLETTIDTNGQD